jgi:hypothetical protein
LRGIVIFVLKSFNALNSYRYCISTLAGLKMIL